MKVSRAGFLKACGIAALGHGVDAGFLLSAFTGTPAGPADLAQTPASNPFRVHNACAAQFRPHVNTAFTLRSPADVRARLILARVVDGPCTASVEQFSLVLHGPAAVVALHGMQTFHHPALGTFDLFITPVGVATTRRTVYEACFSRHVDPADRESGRVPNSGMGDEACRTSS